MEAIDLNINLFIFIFFVCCLTWLWASEQDKTGTLSRPRQNQRKWELVKISCEIVAVLSYLAFLSLEFNVLSFQ